MNATIEIPRSAPNQTRREAKVSRHLPSLDGLRAISISLVVLGHLSGTRHFFNADFGIGDYAHLGVIVFFVISGFLITSLLLAEHEENGTISLRLFYARRAVRIFPAAYFYLICICILWATGVVHISARDVWHAATYTVNYVIDPSWQIGHLWSLSVEEQFYLLWPFAVMALKPKRSPLVAFGAILVGPVARGGMWLFFRGTPYRDLSIFPVVADCLATGCLLAMGRKWLEKQNWYLYLFKPVVSLSLLGIILIINRYSGYTVVSLFGTSITNVCLAVLIHRGVYCSSGWGARILNWKPIAFVGILSYSLYLWQQPFLNRHSDAWVNRFPQNLLFAILAALGSYFLLEKPLLKIRHQLRSYH